MNDSVVLVTGGAGNLGQAVTRRFLEAGARVAVPIYKTDQASVFDSLVSEFGDRLHSFGLDLTTERGSEQAVQRVGEWGGRIDAVAHLIGGYLGEPRLAETDIQSWDRMMDLNLKSACLPSLDGEERWWLVRLRLVASGSIGAGRARVVRGRQVRADHAHGSDRGGICGGWDPRQRGSARHRRYPSQPPVTAGCGSQPVDTSRRDRTRNRLPRLGYGEGDQRSGDSGLRQELTHASKACTERRVSGAFLLEGR
jgi:NAD(P)-dependent dehydrogenase (short-subunit alcohol dehydrogenase family)